VQVSAPLPNVFHGGIDVHELSVCQALLTQVADLVRARGAEAVECITIEVGPLSGTDPDLLLAAFLAMRSGYATTATLLIKHCPVRICCLLCGGQSETQPNRLVCMNCGGWRTRVIAGDQLRLLRVEMRMRESIERRDSHPKTERVGHV
jgi:hydrogenase nickel incorporation protein HypA/HybF